MAAKPHDLVGLMAEAYRLRLLCGLDELLAAEGLPLVAGVDEAGRGCLAGPVVASAVVFDARRPPLLPGVDDSKRLGPEQRAVLAREIRRYALAVSSVEVDASVIDRINILEATRVAMGRALEGLQVEPDVALVDAVPVRGRVPVLPVIRGDSMSYAVACASIVAKTERDRAMEELGRRYPGYELERNKGYASRAHRRALVENGPCPIHRLTFRSVLPRLTEAGGPSTRRPAGPCN